MRQKVFFIGLVMVAACVVVPKNCSGAWATKKTSSQGASATKTPAPTVSVTTVTPEQLLGIIVVCAETSIGQRDWRSAALFTEKANTLASSKSLAAAKSTAPMRQRIGSLQGQLDAEAQRRLKQSRQGDAKKNYAESLKGYRSIITDFPSRPCAADARKALAAAAADPKRKGLLDRIVAAEMEQSIAGLLKRAEGPGANSGSRVERIKALKAPTQATVVAELEKLATKYPSSSEGKRAAADLKALRSDKKVGPDEARRPARDRSRVRRQRLGET